MYTLFVCLVVLASVLMCLIVLIQKSKGGGLASNFASSNQIMGVRKTTDFLEYATWGLAGFIVLFSIFATFSIPEAVVMEESIMQQNAIENSLAPVDFSQEAQVDAAPAEAAPAEDAPAK